MPDSIFTYISKREYHPDKTVLEINNSMYKKRTEKLSKNLGWWGLAAICSVLVSTFQLIKAITNNDTARFWFALILIIAPILITLFIFLLRHLLKNWYKTRILISPKQITILVNNPFNQRHTHINGFQNVEFFINQVISEKRTLAGQEGSINDTNLPIEYDYQKGEETRLELMFRYLDNRKNSQEIKLYEISSKQISSEQRQQSELNYILQEIQFAIEHPGVEMQKKDNGLDNQAFIASDILYKKGVPEQLLTAHILKTTLITKNDALVEDNVVLFEVELLIFDKNNPQYEFHRSIHIKCLVLMLMSSYMKLEILDRGYGYTEAFPDEKFYFKNSPLFSNESNMFWDLKNNHFL